MKKIWEAYASHIFYFITWLSLWESWQKSSIFAREGFLFYPLRPVCALGTSPKGRGKA